MQTNHASALRGLSIAVVILAGLTVLACLIGLIAVGVGGSALANMSPDMWEYYLYDGGSYDYEYYGVDGSDMAAVMAMLVGIGGVALFVALALSAVGLIAGILGLRNYNVPAKLNLVFGWSLAGAICALCTGNMVTMVLLIIMCVFAYKDKQLAAMQPIVVTQPMTAAQPVQPAQPMATTPVPSAPAAGSAASETVTVEEVVTPTAAAESVTVTEQPKAE